MVVFTTNKEKASYLLGVYHGYENGGWPESMSEEQKETFTLVSAFAFQMLSGGAFDDILVQKVSEIVDNLLAGQEIGT